MIIGKAALHYPGTFLMKILSYANPEVDRWQPMGHMWPATAFSVAHGSIQDKS